MPTLHQLRVMKKRRKHIMLSTCDYCKKTCDGPTYRESKQKDSKTKFYYCDYRCYCGSMCEFEKFNAQFAKPRFKTQVNAMINWSYSSKAQTLPSCSDLAREIVNTIRNYIQSRIVKTKIEGSHHEPWDEDFEGMGWLFNEIGMFDDLVRLVYPNIEPIQWTRKTNDAKQTVKYIYGTVKQVQQMLEQNKGYIRYTHYCMFCSLVCCLVRSRLFTSIIGVCEA